MMIRFEIKPPVIEYVLDEIGLDEFEEGDAVDMIEQIMALMIVHNCITVTPAPDAALVEALRAALYTLDIHGLEDGETGDKIRAALASVEPPALFSIWQRFKDDTLGNGQWGLWTCTYHVNLTDADARAKLAEIEADELERRERYPDTMAIYEIRPASKAN